MPAGGGVNALEALRERFVEIPQAVEFIPAVVPDEGVNGHAALLEKLFLPVFQDGQAIVLPSCAWREVRIIVAVDVQFIPGIIMDEGAVGHHAFHSIGQEGASFLAGANSENGGYVPYFSGLQGGFTAQSPWASRDSSAWGACFSSSVRTGREKVISPLLAIGSHYYTS